MSRDGSGTYSPPYTMAVANAIASSATVNAIINDMAQALTDSINKDGSKAFAANQSVGGFKFTSLGAATALTDAAQFSQVQKGDASQATTVAGTVDAVTLAFTPAITSLTSGMRIRWRSGGANTITAPTINIDGLGVKTVKKNPASSALSVGDFGTAGTILDAVYNGTDFILMNPPAAATSLASTTEVLTGTDAAKAVTADALAALWEQGADVASAGVTSLGEGGYFNITGTTTITDIDFGTDKAGRRVQLKFAGALTLTHSATLILPGSANITTAAGDTAEFVSEGSDIARCVKYQKANGQPVIGSTGALIRAPQVLTSGTSYTTPAGCTSIYVECVGAGGGGGGVGNGAGSIGGGGGGAGAYAAKLFSVTPSTAYTCAIGTAGTAGSTAPSSGGAGGNTTLTVGGTTLTANGGGGGASSGGTSGGAGGTASNGDINVTGSGGGKATASQALGGVGGSSFFGGAGAGAAGNGGTGTAGTSGGGGGGGTSTGAAAGAGGAGGAGIIRIWEFN